MLTKAIISSTMAPFTSLTKTTRPCSANCRRVWNRGILSPVNTREQTVDKLQEQFGYCEAVSYSHGQHVMKTSLFRFFPMKNLVRWESQHQVRVTKVHHWHRLANIQ